MSSQKEFFAGCLIGGILGAAAALFIPKNLIASTTQNRRSNHQKSTAHRSNHHPIEKAKSFAIKKTKTRAPRVLAKKQNGH